MIGLRLIAIFVGLVIGAFISHAVDLIPNVWDMIRGQVAAIISVYVIFKWIWPIKEAA